MKSFDDEMWEIRWKIEAMKAVFDTIDKYQHHKKFTKLILKPIKETLGDGYLAYISDEYGSKRLKIFNNAFEKVHSGTYIYINISDGDNWYNEMREELASRGTHNEQYLKRLLLEYGIHNELHRIEVELAQKKEELIKKAESLIEPYEVYSDDTKRHFTYATRKMFPSLLEND